MPARPWSIALACLTAAACVGPPPSPPVQGDSDGAPGGSTDADAADSTAGPRCAGDADCDDGRFCTGEEVCDPASPQADALGCVSGTSPCQAAGTTCVEEDDTCVSNCDIDPDADADGHDAVACGGLDCDDRAPEVNPDQEEICDPLGVDEDCDPTTVGDVDLDTDGLTPVECCNGDVCGTDCNDRAEGQGLGGWANCSACADVCGAQQSCLEGACASARRIFVTSLLYTGDLGGLAGADAHCQSHADAAVLMGSFKAFIVDEEEGLERLEQPAVPFVRVDGVVVASDWDDLVDGSIAAPVELDEFGQPTTDNAWTGLAEVNGGDVASCDRWTYGGGDCLAGAPCGAAGETSASDEHWDGFYVFHCDTPLHLYCVEQ